MTQDAWQTELRSEQRRIEKMLSATLRAERGVPSRLRAAMRHSLLAGGKRLRPVLMLWTWDAAAAGRRRTPVDREAALAAACGLEMLHTYSLIHDDLPAMDDDVLRRGQPTCHVAFDEATAILAGDGLQALGLQRIAENSGSRAASAVIRVTRAIGPAGMVGGQQEDLDSEGQEIGSAGVQKIHRRKTGALLGVSYGLGGVLAGMDSSACDRLESAGVKLGLAFQCADDILDVVATAEQMGKSAGKDQAAGKATWVKLEGLEKTRARMKRYGASALRTLQETLPARTNTERLIHLSRMLWNRDH